MLLLIDNYDSFTYNLVQYFQCLGANVSVYPHDAITLPEINAMNPTHIVLSPGPNSPDEAGISLAVVTALHQQYPILGVCLGHQCIAQAFGAEIIKADEIMHGKTSSIIHRQQGLFHSIANPFRAMRYHSLCIKTSSLPDCFSIDAWAGNTIMAISHRKLPLFGLQFHPESILTEQGLTLLSRFLEVNPL